MNWTHDKIREFRKELKLTQAAFAGMTGVSRNYIAYLERGERKASKTLQLLLDYIKKTSRERKEKGGNKNGNLSRMSSLPQKAKRK